MTTITTDAQELEQELEDLRQCRAEAVARRKALSDERDKLLSNGFHPDRLREIRGLQRELRDEIAEVEEEIADVEPIARAARGEADEIRRRRERVARLERELPVHEAQVKIAELVEQIGDVWDELTDPAGSAPGTVLPSVAELGRAATRGRWISQWLPAQIRDLRDRCLRDLEEARGALKAADR